MATYHNKARDYYLLMNKKCPTLARHGRNLNLCCLEGKLDPCYHRESMIDTMQKILLRKNKANILLTGEAGCGKTALVEGLALAITTRKLLNTQKHLLAQREYKKAPFTSENAAACKPPGTIPPAFRRFGRKAG